MSDPRPNNAAAAVRVCLVGPSIDILGGQAVQAQRLLAALSSSPGMQVSFVAVNPRLSGALGALQRIKYVRTVVTTVAYLAQLLREVRRADVVHAFSASYWSYLLAPLPAMIVARLYGKVAILNYRSGEAEDHLRRWRTAGPSMRRFATRIVVPSEYLVQVFDRFRLKANAIANFVSLEGLPYRRRLSIQPRFLSNRNLEPLYNVACTIQAFAQVQRVHASASLTIAGDGSERPALEALVASLKLSNVRFVGRVPNEQMGGLYDAADVYLNSPNIDNMPGSIIEAFACGIPVVSTDAGGIPFIVTNGQTGLLVEKGDSAAMANACLALISEPERAIRMADAARRQCEQQYVWSAVQRQWEALYRELAGS